MKQSVIEKHYNLCHVNFFLDHQTLLGFLEVIDAPPYKSAHFSLNIKYLREMKVQSSLRSSAVQSCRLLTQLALVPDVEISGLVDVAVRLQGLAVSQLVVRVDDGRSRIVGMLHRNDRRIVPPLISRVQNSNRVGLSLARLGLLRVRLSVLSVELFGGGVKIDSRDGIIGQRHHGLLASGRSRVLGQVVKNTVDVQKILHGDHVIELLPQHVNALQLFIVRVAAALRNVVGVQLVRDSSSDGAAGPLIELSQLIDLVRVDVEVAAFAAVAQERQGVVHPEPDVEAPRVRQLNSTLRRHTLHEVLLELLQHCELLKRLDDDEVERRHKELEDGSEAAELDDCAEEASDRALVEGRLLVLEEAVSHGWQAGTAGQESLRVDDLRRVDECRVSRCVGTVPVPPVVVDLDNVLLQADLLVVQEFATREVLDRANVQNFDAWHDRHVGALAVSCDLGGNARLD